jgi:thiamine transport system permease protein
VPAGELKMIRPGDALVLALPLLFLSAFFFYPLLSILAEGLTGAAGGLTLSHLRGALADPVNLRAILFTVEQALLSTLASVLMGLPGAFLLARYDFRGKSLVKSICTVPFVLPSIIVVLGFVIFFGNNGLLNRALMGTFGLERPPLRVLYSMRAIILAHTFYNFPIAVRLVSAVWSRVNPNLERAARVLGARWPRLFWRVLLPQIAPGLLAASALIFIFCFTSFAVILVLGGGPRYTTIEVAIYRFAKVSLDLKAGSALALVECALSALFMYAYTRFQRRVSVADAGQATAETRSLRELFKGRSNRSGASRPGGQSPGRPLSRAPRLGWLRAGREGLGDLRFPCFSPWGAAALAYLGAAFLLVAAPMLSAVGYSFFARGGWGGRAVFTLSWYRKIFGGSEAGSLSVPYLAAVRNSLLLGTATAAFSLPIGTAIAWAVTRRNVPARGALEALAMLPLGISSVILGLGYLKAYRSAPLAIGGTWYAVAFAHTVIAYPFVVRSATAVFRKIDPALIRAARVLGASPWRTFWTVELPLVRSGIVAGATFAFAISMGEINATLMLAGPKLVTLPIAIYRLISSYNYFAACAMGVLLMLISFLVFLVIDKIGFEVT